MPWTEPEERTGRAPRENRRAGPHHEGGIERNHKTTPSNLRDTNMHPSRKITRRNTSVDGTKDRHRSQQGTAPRGERAGAGKSRERERWAEENEKDPATKE